MGTIKILLQRARDLDTLDLFDQRPYCIMDYGAQKVKSKPCASNGKDPTWETAYKFSVSNDKAEKIMTINIKDENSKKLVGTATADLSTALSRGKDELALPVYTSDNFQQGTLYLKVRYTVATPDSRSAPTTSKANQLTRTDSNTSSQTTPSHANSLKTPTRDQDSKARQRSSSSMDDFAHPEILDSHNSGPQPYNPFAPPPPNPFLARPTSASTASSSTPSLPSKPSSSWAQAAASAVSAVASVLPKSNSSSNASPTKEANGTSTLAAAAAGAGPKRQNSEDSKMVQDLIDQNMALNKELKSLKQAFDEQASVLKARNSELEEMHDLLDKAEREKADAIAAKDSTLNDPKYGPHVQKKLQDENVDLQHRLTLAERERREAEDHLGSMQIRHKSLLEEVNQLKLNLQNTTAELQQARSNERFQTDERDQLQAALRGFEDTNQSKYQKVVDQLEDNQRIVQSLNTEKQRLARELSESRTLLEAAQTKNEEHDYVQQQLRDAWSKNLELQNRIRQLEAASSSTHDKQAAAAASIVADSDQHAASIAAELLSENEFLKKSLIVAKLELAQAKEQNDVVQRNLFRMTSVGKVGA